MARRRIAIGAVVAIAGIFLLSLRKAVLAKDADEAAIRKAAADLGNSIGDAAVLFSKAAGEARPVLTPEQIERLEKFLSERDGAGDK